MLKKSITKRMFIGITAVVVGFAVIILLANTLLLSPLYYNKLENDMVSTMKELTTIDFSENREVWIDEIFSINTGNPYDVIILKDRITIFSSSIDYGIRVSPEEGTGDFIGGTETDLRPKEPFNPSNKVLEWKDKGGDISIGYSFDDRNNNEFLICMAFSDNGYKITLNHAVASVDAGIAQSMLLLIICTGIVLILSIIFAFRFSRGFTKPIKEIQGQVRKISNQDFDSNIDIRTGDELENLGNDVNILSEKLKTALDELQMRNVQLEKDIIAQRSFISNASHELRTPLSLIKGYADELNMDFIKDPEQQKLYHEIISEESTKMKRLLKEMLDLSRLESGRMELNKDEIAVGETINGFLEKYSGFIKEKNLNIEIKLSGNHKCIHDVMRFEQILANYISNAAKYSDNRKKIILSTDVVDDMLRITVFNYGSSISEEAIEHIWDGFYKADNARTRSDDSYGLGLSIVKAIQIIAGYDYGVKNHSDGVSFWFDVKLA